MKNKGPVGFDKKQKIDKKVVKRLISYITGPYKVRFCFVVFFILLSSIVGVISSLFLEVLIDDYISPLLLEPNPVFDNLLRVLLIMAAIYMSGVIANFLYNRFMVVIAQGTLKKIRDDMFAHMQTLPIKYFDTHTHGDIMSHYTNDTDTLEQVISQTFPQFVSSIVTVVTVFLGMLFISPWLTLLVVVMVSLSLLVAGKIGANSAKYFVKQQQSLANVNGYIEELINGQKVVKVFCHESESKKEFDERNETLFNNAYQANKFANILMPIMANIGHIQFVLIAIVGGILAINGVNDLTLGAIASFLILSRNFNMPINQMAQQINNIAMALAGAKRIFELMDEESEVDEGYVTLVNAKYENGNLVETKERTGIWAWKHPHQDGTLTYTEVKGDVRLHEVDFGYEENKLVLHDIEIFAEPGQKVAFVGATGAGKTTITNLINRFYDIADGKVRYDGININKIKKADLRRSLGIVLQDTHLFTGTIKENIKYGKLNATDEEIYNAAKLANADGFIKRLPKGYNTVITGNDSNMSQGQRQLIAIARAAIADPPVMILDEATSSIDTRTEAIVQRGMDSLMKGRTVFVIAHRLSTVRDSDVIMVLDLGRIIERGSHEKLIEEKGKYYQLYTGAFELE